jgi:hypothetical protein
MGMTSDHLCLPTFGTFVTFLGTGDEEWACTRLQDGDLSVLWLLWSEPVAMACGDGWQEMVGKMSLLTRSDQGRYSLADTSFSNRLGERLGG